MNPETSTDVWRRCSSCKVEIAFRSTYWVCSVSTCTRPRTGYFFCSISCWEAHLPMMRHREAWAVEATSPSREQWQRELAEESAGDAATGDLPAARPEVRERRIATPAPRPTASVPSSSPGSPSAPSSPSAHRSDEPLPVDILVVASKLKKYVKAKSGMRTSDTCLEALSEIVRAACNEAIRRAAADGRQTVMDRDFRHY